jgi:hypothetical protein
MQCTFWSPRLYEWFAGPIYSEPESLTHSKAMPKVRGTLAKAIATIHSSSNKRNDAKLWASRYNPDVKPPADALLRSAKDWFKESRKWSRTWDHTLQRNRSQKAYATFQNDEQEAAIDKSWIAEKQVR